MNEIEQLKKIVEEATPGPRRESLGNALAAFITAISTTCSGCDAKGCVIPFDNGRVYCPRCAEEVRDLFGIKPSIEKGTKE